MQVVAADLSTDEGIDTVAELPAEKARELLHVKIVAPAMLTRTAELEGTGVSVRVVCPGIVATEFHKVQGMDLSAIDRMSSEDVVTALCGIELGEVVIAPGVEDHGLHDAVFDADLAAFHGQRPQLASRYSAN